MQSSINSLIHQNVGLAERLAIVRKHLEESAEESPVAASALSKVQKVLLSEKELAAKKALRDRVSKEVQQGSSSNPDAVPGEFGDELKSRFFKFVDERRRDYKEEFNVLQLKLQASECASVELTCKNSELDFLKAQNGALQKEKAQLKKELNDILLGLDSKSVAKGVVVDTEFDSLFGDEKGSAATSSPCPSSPCPSSSPMHHEPLGAMILDYRLKLEESSKQLELLAGDNEKLVLKIQTLSDEFYAQQLSSDDLRTANARLQRIVDSNTQQQTVSSSSARGGPDSSSLRSELEQERSTCMDLKQRIQKMQQDAQVLRESKKEAERKVRMLEIEVEASRDEDSVTGILGVSSGGGGGSATMAADEIDTLKRKLSKLLGEKADVQLRLDAALDESERLRHSLEASAAEITAVETKSQFYETSIQTVRGALQQAERKCARLTEEVESLRAEPTLNGTDSKVYEGPSPMITLYVMYRLWAERARSSRARKATLKLEAETQTDTIADMGAHDESSASMLAVKLQLVNKELKKDLGSSVGRLRTAESELATYKDLYVKALRSDQLRESAASEALPRGKGPPKDEEEDEGGERSREWILEQQRNDAVGDLEKMQQENDLLKDEVSRQGLLMQQMFISQRQGTTSTTGGTTSGIRSFFGGGGASRSKGECEEIRVLTARVKSLQSLLEQKLQENMELVSKMEAWEK